MLACYFLGSLFTDWGPGCYVRCGCIGSPVFSFPVDGRGSVHLLFVVCYCFLFYFKQLFFFDSGAFLRKCVKNIVESDMPRMKIWGTHIACWTPKATNTHSGYVVLIALPLQ